MLLSEALLQRGVLVEKQGNRIYLTDNVYFGPPPASILSRSETDLAALSDQQTVSTLLKSSGFEWFITPLQRARVYKRRCDINRVLFLSAQAYESTLAALQLAEANLSERQWHLAFRLGQPDVEINKESFERLFDQPHFQRESFRPRSCLYRDGKRSFCAHIHSPKVPLSLLDPNIAILVKGLSSVGCFSFSSCQGGEGSPLCVEFIDDINSAWAYRILEVARGEGVLISSLCVEGARLIESDFGSLQRRRCIDDFLLNRNLSEVRNQAIALGVFIYRNRLALRNERVLWGRSYKGRI